MPTRFEREDLFEPERYELVEGLPYEFELDRRDFLGAAGAGLLITVSGSVGCRQQGAVGEAVAPPSRLHIAKDSLITVMTGKVEVGQGSRTQLTQAVAEEMRVPFDSVRLVMADTDRVPDDGSTAGSRTTPRTVPAVRKAAAAAREMLVRRAAELWALSAEGLQVRAGTVSHPEGEQELTYGDLADLEQLTATLTESTPEDIALTRVERWEVLGQPVPHVDGGNIVTGAHRYPSDIVRPGMLYGKILRAPSYGATLSKIDLTPAEDELTGMALGMKDAGAGFLEIVSDWIEPDPESEFAMLRRVVEASGRPAVFSLAQHHDRTEDWKVMIREADRAIEDGHSIRAVCPPRAIGLLLGLEGSQNPFSGTPSYKKIARLPLAERVAAMRDPDFRRQLLSEDPIAESTFPLIERLSYQYMFRFGDPPNYLPREEDSIAAGAAREGRTAPEVAYDVMLEDEGHGFIYSPLNNYPGYDMSAPQAMLSNRNVIMGLGDGGAHVGFILDAGFPAWLITYWQKERRTFDLPEVIRRLTSDTAEAAGLLDRGVIRAGKKADINVIDYDRLRFGKPYVAYDLPAGGKRLLQKAEGYDVTIVSGAVTYRHGEATDALPGSVIEGQRLEEKLPAAE